MVSIWGRIEGNSLQDGLEILRRIITPPIIIFDDEGEESVQSGQKLEKATKSGGKCHVRRHKNMSKKKDCNEKWKGNQPLNIKTAVERPILKLALPNFK